MFHITLSSSPLAAPGAPCPAHHAPVTRGNKVVLLPGYEADGHPFYRLLTPSVAAGTRYAGNRWLARLFPFRTLILP